MFNNYLTFTRAVISILTAAAFLVGFPVALEAPVDGNDNGLLLLLLLLLLLRRLRGLFDGSGLLLLLRLSVLSLRLKEHGLHDGGKLRMMSWRRRQLTGMMGHWLLSSHRRYRMLSNQLRLLRHSGSHYRRTTWQIVGVHHELLLIDAREI